MEFEELDFWMRAVADYQRAAETDAGEKFGQ